MNSLPEKQGPLYVRVDSVKDEAIGIKSYRLGPLDGGELPAFTAGAHIGVIMPTRITRYYSLCSSPLDRRHYTIAVQKVHDSGGGSRLMHDRVRPGMMLKLQRPRNYFALSPARSYLLVAGGIGITPIKSMIYELDAKDASYRLIYCVRSRAQLPFVDEVSALAARGRAIVHIRENAGGQFDFKQALAETAIDERLYCCGSPQFMKAVKEAASHWDPSHIHFESFASVSTNENSFGFEVMAVKTDKLVQVSSSQSILEALRENGINPDSGCENGTCGACRTGYISGTVDHRDYVLSSDERTREIMICVSRAKYAGETLALNV